MVKVSILTPNSQVSTVSILGIGIVPIPILHLCKIFSPVLTHGCSAKDIAPYKIVKFTLCMKEAFRVPLILILVEGRGCEKGHLKEITTANKVFLSIQIMSWHLESIRMYSVGGCLRGTKCGRFCLSFG